MFINLIPLAAVVIIIANLTRKQWPRKIFDIVIYVACAVIILDYIF